MDVHYVAVPDIVPELADRLQEGQYLDVAHGSADLGDDHVQILSIPQAANAILDLVGDVRDDLDCVAQIVAPPLLVEHCQVDGSGG